ncbi:MAG: 4Fe-4S binding protein [Fusobacteria bacterium]|nr:4Fe-4S binding protein [Fusobacteriota bacterium]
MITVSKERCPQNHRCPSISVCPVSAISQEEFSLPVVDNEKCIMCKKCMRFCPRGAFLEI